MANIFARSPFIISINEAAQTSSKIEVFLWNGSGSAPTTPTYTVSKAIPSSTNLNCLYNISNYIREYISFNQLSINYDTVNPNTSTLQWCNVRVKRYKNTSTLLDTTDYKAFDGYAFYSDGANYDISKYLLAEGTYYYHYDSATTIDVLRTGTVTVDWTAGYKIRYTNLVTAAVQTYTIASAGVYDLFRVYPTYWSVGNKLEILTGANAVVKTYYFKPITECKYTPVTIDFVNRFGAWQREFFFKATQKNFSVESKDYNLLQTNISSYNQKQGQTKRFNINGRETDVYNSGWVEESFKNTIKEIMLSEKILVAGTVRTLATKSMKMQTSLNDNNINYTLEFTDAFDTMSNVL
jgi:hypothetical protein